MAITNATLAQQIADLVEARQNIDKQFQEWITGVVGGGVSSDGRYPLTDYFGVTRYTLSPAQLEDNVEGSVGAAAASAAAALASEQAAASSESAASIDEGLADAHRIAAISAQGLAEAARDTAVNAQVNATASQVAAGLSETNAAASEVAAGLSEDAALASEIAAAASAAAAATFDPLNFYLRTALDGGQLDNRYYTETEIDATFANYTLTSGLSIADWNTAFGWGNHAGLYETIDATLVRTTDLAWNATDWDTAFGWGNHAGLYSLSAHNHSGVYEPVDATIVRTGDAAWNATDWDTAFGWGNHATAGYAADSGAYLDRDIGNLTTGALSGGDLDAVGVGFSRWTGTQPSVGSPGWNYGMVLTTYDGAQNIQLAWGSSTKGRLAVRRKDSGSYVAWSEFAPLASPDFTGTVDSLTGNYTTAAAEHTFTTPSGYIELGPKNTTWGHIYTDRAGFYFNKNVVQAGTYFGGAAYGTAAAPTFVGNYADPDTGMYTESSNVLAFTTGGVRRLQLYNAIANFDVPLDIEGNCAATTFNGYGLAEATGGSPPGNSAIVKTHTNGYTYLGWINTVSGATTTDPLRIYASQDSFLRYMTPAAFIDFLEDEDWNFGVQVDFLGAIRAANGMHGGYSVLGGNSTFGATIWGIGASYDGPVAGNDSANTSVYGIRWLRSGHVSAQAAVGEGLYVYQNGVFEAGMGTAGIYSAAGLRVDGNCDFNGNIVGDGASTISGIETITIDSTGDITKASHGNYLYHQSTTYDDDQEGGVTFSTSAPSGGADGDIWFEYT